MNIPSHKHTYTYSRTHMSTRTQSLTKFVLCYFSFFCLRSSCHQYLHFNVRNWTSSSLHAYWISSDIHIQITDFTFWVITHVKMRTPFISTPEKKWKKKCICTYNVAKHANKSEWEREKKNTTAEESWKGAAESTTRKIENNFSTQNNEKTTNDEDEKEKKATTTTTLKIKQHTTIKILVIFEWESYLCILCEMKSENSKRCTKQNDNFSY